ncbi:potassium-transporting ATPase subunit B, partial [Kitasatospora sp. NPDC053057]
MSTPTLNPAPADTEAEPAAPHRVSGGLLDPKLIVASLPDAVKKLDPRVMVKNPVMFVVEVGSVVTTVSAIANPSVFAWSITVWLWLTTVFANLAEAVAEGRGKAQADTLRRTKTESVARRLTDWPATQDEEEVPGTALRLGDHVVVEAGQIIP